MKIFLQIEIYFLEFVLLELPKPDIAVFLHMPTDKATILKKDRKEAPDGHEKDINHLKEAEKSLNSILYTH